MSRTSDNRRVLLAIAERYGIAVEQGHPGDGITRYTFVNKEGKVLGRALGLRDAMSWLEGFIAATDRVLTS